MNIKWFNGERKERIDNSSALEINIHFEMVVELKLFFGKRLYIENRLFIEKSIKAI